MSQSRPQRRHAASIQRYEEQAKRRIGACIAGRYELVGILGVGGYGAVYEAHHRYTQRRVAVKLLHDKLAQDPSVTARFMREAQTVGALKHPNIPSVLDAGIEHGCPFLVMEYLDGETLNQRLSRASMPLSDLLDIFGQIFEALSAAHERGIVHRDIKPANVFLVNQPEGVQVKLLDFGVARSMTGGAGDGLTRVGQVLGTPHYMAPEHVLGRPLDGRSDLWSMGVLMYRCLTGQFPHLDGRHDAALFERIVRPRIVPLKRLVRGLPQDLIRLVHACLQAEPARRLHSAAEGATRCQELKDKLRKRYARARPTPAVAHPAYAVSIQQSSNPVVLEEPDTTPESVPVAGRPGGFVRERSSKRPSWEAALERIEHETLQRPSRPRRAPAPETRPGWFNRMLGWAGDRAAPRSAA